MSVSMTQFAVHAPGEAVRAVKRETPALNGRSVLVRITRSGVCHSDVHCQDGYFDMGAAGRRPLSSTWPAVFGHEIVGEVVAVGPDADATLIGQSFIVYPWIGCGDCEFCAAGEENRCATGRIISGALDGGFADHVWVPDSKYLVAYDDIDPSWAATLACSGVTAYAAVKRLLPTRPESPIAVIGAGGLGLNAVAILRAHDHENIVVLDRSQASLERAHELGAKTTIQTSEGDSRTIIADTLGEKIHGVVDFVNSGETAETAVFNLRKSGTLVSVGLFGGEMTLPTVPIPFGMLSILGGFVGTQRELEELVDLVRTGAIPRVPLDEKPMTEDNLNESLTALREGRARGRAVLTN